MDTRKEKKNKHNCSKGCTNQEKGPCPLNIYLDLDETLIHSIPFNDYDELDSTRREKLQNTFDYNDMEDEFRVFSRPGLYDFLFFLSNNSDKFTINVWTAATRDYADFIIMNILQKKFAVPIRYRLHRSHVNWSQNNMSSPKDLRTLWKKYMIKGHCECNTVIIDDLKDVVKSNNYYSIRINPFVADPTKTDKELYRIREELKELYKCYKSTNNINNCKKKTG